MRHVGWSSEPLLGSTDADGLPKIGRISITRRTYSCASHPSASCSENFEDEAKLDVKRDDIVKEWRQDNEKNPIGSFVFSSHSAPQSRWAAFDTDIARHVLPAVGDPSTIPYRVAPPIKR